MALPESLYQVTDVPDAKNQEIDPVDAFIQAVQLGSFSTKRLLDLYKALNALLAGFAADKYRSTLSDEEINNLRSSREIKKFSTVFQKYGIDITKVEHAVAVLSNLGHIQSRF